MWKQWLASDVGAAAVPQEWGLPTLASYLRATLKQRSLYKAGDRWSVSGLR